mmetsp:Transcript_123640/g.384969  ORF Transcript_123640/g.384969 Transcript_123640/m.384969 type:complete len:188 (+) Transcript_123640:119-682(+)
MCAALGNATDTLSALADEDFTAQRFERLPSPSSVFSGCTADELLEWLEGIASPQVKSALLRLVSPPPYSPALDSLPPLEEVFQGTSAEEVLECLEGLPPWRAAAILKHLRKWPVAPRVESLPPWRSEASIANTVSEEDLDSAGASPSRRQGLPHWMSDASIASALSAEDTEGAGRPQQVEGVSELRG